MTALDPYEIQVAQILRELGIQKDFNKRKPFRETTELVSIGKDIYGREQKLAPNAASAWRKLKMVAEGDGLTLQIVSAFRSVAYQRQIIERKLTAGKTMEEILRVSAAPGYSEHHTGRAIDLTSSSCKPLTEEFEQTSEFAWFVRCAKDFGFSMTYPRDNKFGGHLRTVALDISGNGRLKQNLFTLRQIADAVARIPPARRKIAACGNPARASA
jgi:zinc D-Ala-D-Ala carboxypeptidase